MTTATEEDKVETPPPGAIPPELIPHHQKKLDAETRKLDAEAAKAEAEARKATLDAEEHEFNLGVKMSIAQLNESKRLVDDEFHHVYRFYSQVDTTSVDKCIKQLLIWARLEPGCDITLAINSPGGSVVDGFALWDTLQELRTAGHKIKTVSYGMAASMGGILLQAGDVRAMGRRASLLIHEAAFGAQGSMGKVEDQVKWVKKMQDQILDIFADRSKMNRATIKKNWARTDWWLTADEALKHGFIDEVIDFKPAQA